MAITILSSFGTPNVSDTKLLVNLTSSLTGNDNFKYVLDITKSDGTPIARLKTIPNPVGSGIFDVSDIIQGDLEYDANLLTSITASTSIAADTYTFEVGEEYGNPPAVYMGDSFDKKVFKGSINLIENNNFNLAVGKFRDDGFEGTSSAAPFNEIRGAVLSDKPYNRMFSKLPLTLGSSSAESIGIEDTATLSVFGDDFVKGILFLNEVQYILSGSGDEVKTVPAGPKNLSDYSSDISSSFAEGFDYYAVVVQTQDGADYFNSTHLYVNEALCDSGTGSLGLPNHLKYTNASGWRSIPATPNRALNNMGFGDGDAAISAGGFNGAVTGFDPKDVYEWDGFTWSLTTSWIGSTPNGLFPNTGFGNINAGILSFESTEVKRINQEWNGSSFSNLPARTGGDAVAGIGTTSAGLVVGGDNDAAVTTDLQEWNGSAWSAGPTINESKEDNFGGQFGTANAGVISGGTGFPTNQRKKTYEYNGASWSVGGNLINPRLYNRGAGVANAGATFGSVGGSVGNTEYYNGNSWSQGPNMNHFYGGVGSMGDGSSTTNMIMALGGVAEVWDENFIGPTTSSFFSFQDNKGKKPETDKTRFAFANKYGQWDYYTTYTTPKRTTNVKHKYTSIPVVDYSSNTSTANFTDRNKKTVNTTTDNLFDITTDILLEEEANWLNQLLDSPQAFVYHNQEWLPIIIVSSNYRSNTNKRGQKIFTQNIQFKFSKEKPPIDFPRDFRKQKPFYDCGKIDVEILGTGEIIVTTVDDAEVISIVPSSFPYAWTPTLRDVTITVKAPDGFENEGNQIVCPKEVSQQALHGYWKSAPPVLLPRNSGAGFGSQNAAVFAGGYQAAPPSGGWVCCTEEYNGQAWSQGGALINRFYQGAGAGTQNAGLVFGGFAQGPGLPQNVSCQTQEYDGASWSTANNMNVAKENTAGGGTQNNALNFGGHGQSPNVAFSCTEGYNGTSWSTCAQMVYKRKGHGGDSFNDGAVGAIAAAGLDQNNCFLNTWEEFNGSSWSINSCLLRHKRRDPVISGTNADAIIYGGLSGSVLSEAEYFNGTSWSTDYPLINARHQHAGSGGSDAALTFGGTSCIAGNANIFASEEYNCGPIPQFTYNDAGVYNFLVEYSGSVNPPTASEGTITDLVYSAGYDSGSNSYPIVTVPTTRSVEVSVEAPTGWPNSGSIVSGSEFTVQQNFISNVWVNGPNMPKPFSAGAGFGTQEYAIHAGGNCDGGRADTLIYSGSSWSTGPNMPNNNYHSSGFGNSGDAGVVALGICQLLTFPYRERICAFTYDWNGSSWSTGGNQNTARAYATSFGTANAGVTAGGCCGPSAPADVTCVEKYNGSSWSTATALPSNARKCFASAGTSNSGLVFGGSDYLNPSLTQTDSFNGSAWASEANLIVGRRALGGAGDSDTEAIAFGGQDASSRIESTEQYNGISWSSIANMQIAKSNFAHAGNQDFAIAMGGSEDGIACTNHTQLFYCCYEP